MSTIEDPERAGAQTVKLPRMQVPVGSRLPDRGVSGRWVVAGIFGSIVAALVLAGVLALLFGSGIQPRARRAADPAEHGSSHP